MIAEQEAVLASSQAITEEYANAAARATAAAEQGVVETPSQRVASAGEAPSATKALMDDMFARLRAPAAAEQGVVETSQRETQQSSATQALMDDMMARLRAAYAGGRAAPRKRIAPRVNTTRRPSPPVTRAASRAQKRPARTRAQKQNSLV